MPLKQNWRILHSYSTAENKQLECGPMPNVMVALPNMGGSL